MLAKICEGELKHHDGDALSDHFKGNISELSQALSNDQKQEAVLCIHQVAKAEDRATLDEATLKLLAECLIAVNQGDNQHKKLYYRQFAQGISFEFGEDEDRDASMDDVDRGADPASLNLSSTRRGRGHAVDAAARASRAARLERDGFVHTDPLCGAMAAPAGLIS